MKQYEIKTESGPIFREYAASFSDLARKISTWPSAAVPSLLGSSYRPESGNQDWYVTATATKHGKPTASFRNLWIRIDGLGNVECNPA